METFVPEQGYEATDRTYLNNNLEYLRPLPYLAKTIAEVFDRSILDQRSFQLAEADRVQLMAPFLVEKEFSPIRATELLCGQGHRPDEWRTCALKVENAILDDLSGKVAIITSVSDDLIQTPGAPSVPGGVVLATYVEALLSNSYYERAGATYGLLLSLVWFGIIQLVWMKWATRVWRALLISILVSVGFVVGVHFFLARLFNQWVLLWPPGAIAIVGKLLENLKDTRRSGHVET